MKKLLAILLTLSLLLCALPAMAEAAAVIPEDLVGEWRGTGMPKNGGPAIDLTATINADGSGEYTFDQSGYHESYPFTISSDDSAFSVNIPADNTLGIARCEGTWALEGGILKLDITTTFASGGSYAYTAECGKAAEDGDAAPEPTEAPVGDSAMALPIRDGATLACGSYHTVGVKADGTVVATGASLVGQCNVDDWTDVVAVAAGEHHTVGLRADGTVLATGHDEKGQCDVQDWTDIVAIAAGGEQTVGLKADGTVVATGRNSEGQCDVGDWTDIVAVAAGVFHTVGLKADGTVVAVGYNSYHECDVGRWTDIVAVAAGNMFTVGLKADGTVVATGKDDSGQCETYSWANIVAIACGKWETVGLRADGKVISKGGNTEKKRCDTSGWGDIMAVAAGQYHTVGLKWDGTVVATGDGDEGQCRIDDWEDIAITESMKRAAEGRPEPTPEPSPTPTPEYLTALRDMHKRAIHESGLSANDAPCTGDVIVAYFSGPDEEALPDQVLTADSEDEWAFPREYRAQSYETARWAAVIFPTRTQVGRYSGIAGGAANQTTTWLCLFDLQDGTQYKLEVATEDPPQTINIQIINGVPQYTGASGKYRDEDAFARLTELVEAAR